MNQYQKEYVEFLRGFLSSSNPSTSSGNKEKQKALKVVFDCSNGTSGLIVRGIMNQESRVMNKNQKNSIHNSRFKILNSTPNGNFPAHGPNPLKPGAMKQIQKEVLKNKADFGVIFDADGDRAFFIDDKGRVVDPDVIASLLIWHLKAKKIVITEITSNIIRESRIKNHELRIIRSQNGGYFIKNKMIENGVDFGCERSGHYYFRINAIQNNKYIRMPQKKSDEVFYMDSGILAAIHVINAISKLPYKLSDFVDLSPVYFRSKELNTRIDADENADLRGLFEKIEKHFLGSKSNELKAKSYVDGLRMDFKESGIASQSLGKKDGLPSRSLGGGWWFNIQLSNTEPLMRLNVEATNKQTLAKQTKMLLGLLRNK